MRRRLILALALAACVTGTARAADWQTLQVDTAGFSLGLPSSWVGVTATTPPETVAALGKNPGLKSVATLAQQTDAIKLVAGDPSSRSGAYMDVGVQRVGKISLAKLAAAMRTALQKSPRAVGAVRLAAIKLPAGEAYVLRFGFKSSIGALETVEYVLIRDQVEFAFGYTALRTSVSHYTSVFNRSIHSLRFPPATDLSQTVLAARQVGAGYRLASFPGGDSVIGETTLDLCGGSFPSERLRTARLQVRYLGAARAAGVSNEVVTYVPGGAQEALTEVTKVAAKCVKKPAARKVGADHYTITTTPITAKNLLPGAVAVKFRTVGVVAGARVDQTGVAIYQVKGNALSGVYTYTGQGTPPGEAVRVGLHAAQQSARNLTGLQLAA